MRESIDFEVVSVIVMDTEYTMHSIDHFLRVNGVQDLLLQRDSRLRELSSAHNMLQELGLSDRILEISKTPFPKRMDDGFLLFKLDSEIDFDLAISLGLGVVKMLRGEDAGHYFLYYPQYGFIDSLMDCYEGDQQLLIQVYLQLTHPQEYDPDLEQVFRNDQLLLCVLIMHDPQSYLTRLEKIFKNHKVH